MAGRSSCAEVNGLRHAAPAARPQKPDRPGARGRIEGNGSERFYVRRFTAPVGIVNDRRGHPDLWNMIGAFTHSPYLRIEIRDNDSFLMY